MKESSFQVSSSKIEGSSEPYMEADISRDMQIKPADYPVIKQEKTSSAEDAIQKPKNVNQYKASDDTSNDSPSEKVCINKKIVKDIPMEDGYKAHPNIQSI